MGFGASKIPPDTKIKAYRHKEKIDGTLATTKEEERRKERERILAERLKEIEEKKEEYKQIDERYNYFYSAKR